MSALAKDLTSLGMPPALASRMGIQIKSITATGTGQGTPLVYSGDYALLTTAASTTACTLDSAFPVGETAYVANVSTVTGLIYPPTGGNINGGSTNNFLRLPAASVATVTRTSTTAFWVQLSGAAASATPTIIGGATDSVTAIAGGGQTNATQLIGALANVTVVATAADSVKLPLAQAGMVFFLQNSDAADSMQVFGAGTDTINGVATATGVAQAAGKSAMYFAITSAPAGKWFRVLSA
jgi:hypothetical protein